MSAARDRRVLLASTLSRLSIGLTGLALGIVATYLLLGSAGISLARTRVGDVVLATVLWTFALATPVLTGGSIVLGRGRLSLRLSYLALAVWGVCAVGALALH